MRDPYDVLGVARTAGEADIKKAFRKLAKIYHPDTSKGDPKSKEKFAEVNAAYEILGDADKRRKFDSGEIGADGNPRFANAGFGGGAGGFRQPGGGGFRSTEDFLGDIFGDAFSGFAGGGRGRQRRSPFDEPGQGPGPAKGVDVMIIARIRLEDIVGSGKHRVTLANGRSVDVKIPHGFEPGQQMRLKGQGGEGMPPGDAILILTHEPHPLFRPDGIHLRLDLPVSLDEAVMGAKLRVPTLDGAVEMSLPAGLTGSKALRLKGRGLFDKAGNRGDLYVTPRIILPETPDSGLEQLMKRWRELRPYDPRGPEFA